MKKKYLKAFLTGLIVVLSLTFSIIIKQDVPFDLQLFIIYILIGIFVFVVSIVFSKLNIRYATNVLLLMSIISGLYLYIMMPKGSDGLSQLSVGLAWFMMMGTTILITFIYTIIILITRWSKKQSKNQN